MVQLLRAGKVEQMNMEAAKAYCGTTPVSGECQLQLLKWSGLDPRHKLLEIGCGCLNGGAKIINYLDAGNYVGVDPNDWLVEIGRREQGIDPGKNPRFMFRDDFNPRIDDSKFDFIFAHSVLSHAAHWQLSRFLCACRMLTNEGSIVLASIRLAEGNEFGSKGRPDRKDSMDFDWQYPGNSWFTFRTVHLIAEIYGFNVSEKTDYTDFYVGKCPEECHDWLEFWR